MQSKNKAAQTAAERRHVARVKLTACAVCDKPASESEPNEAHEIEQGLWWTSIALCADCHRGSHNGLHGRRAMWKVTKHTELTALNVTIRRLFA